VISWGLVRARGPGPGGTLTRSQTRYGKLGLGDISHYNDDRQKRMASEPPPPVPAPACR
jgi:hypothetical protein